MSATCSVVVADDNHDAADTLVELINGLGYAAMATYSGHEAIAACLAMKPEVAILDVEMPMLDGCAAARLIRLGPHPPSTIAAMSALRHWDEPMKSQGAAFDIRLAKPARVEELRELLARAAVSRVGARRAG